MKKKKIKKLTKKRIKILQKRADKKLWKELREKVKVLQDNRCFVCDKVVESYNAHTHHIISRSVKELKFDIQNLILLCPLDHKFGSLSVHKSSIVFAELLRTKQPERYYYLLRRVEEINNANKNT